MPKGNSAFVVTCASATMSFPCGYIYIGDKKAKAITIRLHKKKCPECISNINATLNNMVEYDADDVLPSGLDKKGFDRLNNKFIMKNELPDFEILKKIETI